MKWRERVEAKIDQWFPYAVCTVYSGRMYAKLLSNDTVVYGDRHFKKTVPLSACSDELIDMFNKKLGCELET